MKTSPYVKSKDRVFNESHEVLSWKQGIRRRAPRRHGIGRREVLVIFALVTLMFMVLVPYLARQRYLARRGQCEMHQIRVAQAVLQFEMDHGSFPGYKNARPSRSGSEPAATGWVYPILPYLSAVPDGDPGDPPRRYIPELVCPENSPQDADASLNWNSYVVNTGLPDASSPGEFPPDWPANGVFMDRYSANGLQIPAVSIDSLKDGADHTFLLTENVDCGAWTDSDEPQVGFVWVAEFVDGEPSRGNRLLGINQQAGKGDGSIRFARPSCYHSGGVNVTFCSERTMFFNQQCDYLAFARLMMSDPSSIQIPGSDQPIDPPYRDVTTPDEPDNDQAVLKP